MIMKKSFLLSLVMTGLVFAGCGGGDDGALPAAPSAPAGDVSIGGATPQPGPAPAAIPGQTSEPAPAQAIEPQLAPLQSAIQTFEQQNKRMPLTVQEMVDAGVLKSVPPPPAGKLYYIDQATKQVKMGSDP
jgi:hypothetical protein